MCNRKVQLLRRLTITIVFLTPQLLTLSVARVPARAQSQAKLLVQNSHTLAVTSLAYNPSGTVVASGSKDFTIKIWDIRSGVLLQNLVGHSREVTCLTFSATGRYVVSGSLDGTVRLWDVETGQVAHTMVGHKSEILAVAISPNDRYVASAGGWFGEDSDNSVKLWDVQTGTLLSTLEGHTGRVNSIAFSPNGQSLISGSHDATIKIWSVSSRSLRASYDNLVRENPGTRPWAAPVIYVASSPDNVTFAAFTYGSMQFRNLSNGETIRAISVPYVTAVVISPDWKTILVGPVLEAQTQLIRTDTGNPIAYFPESAKSLRAISFSPDSKAFASGDVDGNIKVWNTNSQRPFRSFSSNAFSATAATLNPSGTIIAWATHNKIKLWDIRAGKMLASIEGHSSRVNCLVFSPDGKYLASGSAEDSVRVWSVPSGQLIRLVGNKDIIHAVAFSPDGRTLASGSTNKENNELAVKLCDWRSGRLIRRLMIHRPETLSSFSDSEPKIMKVSFSPVKTTPQPIPSPFFGAPDVVLSIQFSPDGKRIASGSTYQVANIWNLNTGVMLHELKGHNYSVTSVAFSPNGAMLVTSGTDVKIWDSFSGRLLNTLDKHNDYINMVDVSPNGRTIASASNDRTIKVWDATTGSLLKDLVHHGSGVNSVKYSPDGKLLVSASIDATVNLSSFETGAAVATIVSFHDNSWIANTPDGYCISSPGASRYVSWRLDGSVYSFSSFQAKYVKPELVLDRLRTGFSPVTAKVLENQPVTVRDPSISISAEEARFREKWKSMRFYALVIGVGHYKSNAFGKPKTPLKNANEVARVLQFNYGIQVKLLSDTTRSDLIRALDSYRSILDDNSSLLIYYTGHGAYDDASGVAYWQPADAEPRDSATWVSSDDIMNQVRAMNARHILVVADSCFSGGISESSLAGQMWRSEPMIYLDKRMTNPSRMLMSSTDKDFTDDEGPDGYSFFTHAFLRGLKSTDSNIFSAEQLFENYIRVYVAANVNQNPQFKHMRNMARPGQYMGDGNFIFIRQRR